MPDQYELERYLNVLHETDRHLGRLFDTVRRLKLDQDTLIVVIGDHGQAFGYPHNTYIQGRTMYEEDVHVPLMFWSPRRYQMATRSKTVGSQVDLAPTIAELAGVPAAADWQGRSLFDTTRSSRAYFYVAEDHFTLGLREGNWKYIFALREGVEELYDLDKDPDEQHNLVKGRAGACGSHAPAARSVDRSQPPPVRTRRRSRARHRHSLIQAGPFGFALRASNRWFDRNIYTVVWLESLHAAQPFSSTRSANPTIDVVC